MGNYITINGQQIPLTDEQIQQIISDYDDGNKQVKLAEIPAGGTFKIGDREFVVLDNCGEVTVSITKDVVKTMKFGSNNNYEGSEADTFCKEFANELAEQIGADNLVEFPVDLTSDDGLKDYGKITRYMALMTADQYREYVEILDKHKPDEWWWLATPYSTARHENDLWVKCVSPAGIISSDYYFGCDGIGVRPFCIFNSDISVSSEQ